jgi:hypothetical protein
LEPGSVQLETLHAVFVQDPDHLAQRHDVRVALDVFQVQRLEVQALPFLAESVALGI